MDLWSGPLQVEVESQEVWRALGYRAGNRPTRPVAQRMEALWPRAVSLLHPRGAHRLVGADDAAETGMPAPTRAVLGVCTIGPELDEACTRHQTAGATMEALLLDAIGSAAAEAAADALNALICDRAARLGLYCEPRESPGYGAWAIACQPRLLALLPAAELGVSLTPGLMMTPRKSVSFAVRLADRPGPAGISCERCGLTTCAHRRTALVEGRMPGVRSKVHGPGSNFHGPGSKVHGPGSKVEGRKSKAEPACPPSPARGSCPSTPDSGPSIFDLGLSTSHARPRASVVDLYHRFPTPDLRLSTFDLRQMTYAHQEAQ